MRRAFCYRVCYIVFYFYWWIYTLVVVPPMGDTVYFILCLISAFGLMLSGFPYFESTALPQSVIAHSSKRRPQGHKEAEWRALVDKYQGRCLCCKRKGTPANPITRDHIIPRIKGGPDTIDNLQPLCKSCNSRKRDKTIDYRPGRHT